MPRFLKILIYLVGLQCCLLSWCLAGASETAASFARVDRDDSGRARALQVAIARYVSASGGEGLSVDLIGAVHIADKAYYEVLNERFRRYDVLLFELVTANPDIRVTPGQPRKGFLTGLQLQMKNALGLAFQLDEIDYGAANFVHADFSAEQLFDSMEQRGESLYVYFWRLFYSLIDEYARDPLGLQEAQLLSSLVAGAEEDAFKIALANELVRATRAGDIFGDGRGSAIIEARNERALEVMHEHRARGARRIGIFYGAAHMADFDRRLRNDLGLRRIREEWQDAWLFKPADDESAAPAPDALAQP